jgi:hypothetical protein
MTETPSHDPQPPTTPTPTMPFGEVPSEALLSEAIRFDVKVFTAEDASVEPDEMIPVFHRWIQTGHLDDLLIDVADYCHVPEGPGVILVGHDAHYAFDRPGLLYSRRRETHASLQGLETIEDRLASVLRSALAVCRKLESESSLAGRLRFRGDEMVLRVNDRLRAPNTDAAAAALEPALEALLGRLYPGVGFEIEREGEPRDLLTLRIRARRSVPVAVLLGRLGGFPSRNGHGAS